MQNRSYSNKLGSRSRRLILPVAAALLLTAASFPVTALFNKAEAAQASALQLKKMEIAVQGKKLSVPAGTADGQTFVGLSFLSRELGMTTSWDAKTRTISVSKKNKTMKMKAGDGSYSLNGHDVNAKAPIVLNGTTYLPLRFLLEQMGFSIGYDASTKLITITPLAENDVKLINKTMEFKHDIFTVSVQYPQLEGLAHKDAQKKINAALVNEARRYVNDGGKLLKDTEQSVADGDLSKEQASHFMYNVDYTITYNEKNKLSLHFDMENYTGGAHGMYDYDGHTFDLATGGELTLQEAAGGNPDYSKIINDEIKRQIKEKDIDLIAPFETIKPDQRFFLRGDSIVVYFGLYEYTPYAYGIPEFAIPVSMFAQK